MSEVVIEKVWWRRVQLGEFYNIERHPQIAGGGGSLYIEIPTSMKEKTLNFLGYGLQEGEAALPISIEAHVISDPMVTFKLEFKSKAGNRLRISNQNRRQESTMRHPAWTKTYGFPEAADWVNNREEAAEFYPEGGLRIYIARSTDGEYFAGFTKGPRPDGMTPEDPSWELYDNKAVGGVIEIEGA